MEERLLGRQAKHTTNADGRNLQLCNSFVAGALAGPFIGASLQAPDRR